MIRNYDPAISSNLQIILTYSGLHAVWFYRISHQLWQLNLKLLAHLCSQWGRLITGVEIHPGTSWRANWETSVN